MSVLHHTSSVFAAAARILTGTANGRVLSLTLSLLLAVLTFFAATDPESYPEIRIAGAAAPAETTATTATTSSADLARAKAFFDTRIEEVLPDLDPLTIETMRAAIEALSVSADAEKRTALGEFINGERDAAIARLEAHAAAQSDAGLSARALNTWREAGALAFLVNPAAARRAYEAALDIDPQEASARYHLGLLMQQARLIEPAEAQFRNILYTDKYAGTPWEAAAESNLGILAIQRGDFELAEYHTVRSLQYNEILDRPKAVALQHANLGIIAMSLGKEEAAERNLLIALEQFEALGETSNIARTLSSLGLLEQARDELETAAGYFQRSFAVFKMLDDHEGMAAQLGFLARTQRLRGNIAEAEALYRESASLNRQLGRHAIAAAQYASLGGIEYDRGNVFAACAFWRQSRDVFAGTGTVEGLNQVQSLFDQAGCNELQGG